MGRRQFRGGARPPGRLSGGKVYRDAPLMRHDLGHEDQTIGQADALSARAGRTRQARSAPLDPWPDPGQPGHVDGDADAAGRSCWPSSCRTSRPKHKVVASRWWTGVGAISSALATPIVGMLSDAPPTAGGWACSAAAGTADARQWPCSPPPAWWCCRAGHGVRRGPAVVPVQRVPERRVRQPERGHPGPRCRYGSAPRSPAGWACRSPSAWCSAPSWSWTSLDQRLVAGYVTLALLMVLLALPFVLFTSDYPLAPHGPGAVLLAPAGRVLTAQPAGVPRFRLGPG